ncbi:hypothetical protein Lgra_3173 [Legionella gratiana]|uniref:CN hydrolase domain-containing protein n=1 Tax=Legionella gratiana TaxID=45066 RepID=A0A378JC77_9GAMM|nr:hypothetical protein [Legionella gratiana]KTD06396.1 hypothetical protein Lgra_3173 [Legionella gratiana]STX45215.1 Uncharacterised protein [Legionella gratiana]
MKNLILSFNFSKLTGEASPKFTSFEEKLQLYLRAFEDGYNLARQKFPKHRIILLTHEYAITKTNPSNSKILDYSEHLRVQERLKEFTRLNQNCVVIFPYAFAKEYHNEHQFPKLLKIAQRYQENSHKKSAYTVEQEDFENYLDKSQTNNSDHTITVVRNVCYLLSGGIILNKVDKRVPCFEYTLPNSSTVRAPLVQGSTLFQPGTNRNIISLNKTQSLAIEICADHASGLLKSTWKPNKSPATYHLIVADSTPLNTKNLIGKFNILCDAITGTSLIQQKGMDKKEAPIVIAIKPEFNEGLLEYTHKYVKPEIVTDSAINLSPI